VSLPDRRNQCLGLRRANARLPELVYYISLANDARGLSPFLIVASTFDDQQNLTARMTMPIQLCTSLIDFSSCTPKFDLLYTEPYGSV